MHWIFSNAFRPVQLDSKAVELLALQNTSDGLKQDVQSIEAVASAHAASQAALQTDINGLRRQLEDAQAEIAKLKGACMLGQFAVISKFPFMV